MQADQESAFPKVKPDSKIIFGNEIDCFIVEFPATLQPNFFYSPMILQQKTGQESLRYDPNTIFMVGGTDYTRTKISSKFYKFTLQSNQVQEFDKLTTPRYFPSFLSVAGSLYVLGGLGDKATPLASCERIPANVSDLSVKWTDLPPMSAPRFGHVAWSDAANIIVIGGRSSQNSPVIDAIEVFDTGKNTWSTHGTLRSRSRKDEPSALQAGALRARRSNLPRRRTRQHWQAIQRSLQIP
jgi:Galactose oxidase, central domain